jgi:hypothetical protein
MRKEVDSMLIPGVGGSLGTNLGEVLGLLAALF